MEFANLIEHAKENSRLKFILLATISVLIISLGVITYLFFYDTPTYNNDDMASDDVSIADAATHTKKTTQIDNTQNEGDYSGLVAQDSITNQTQNYQDSTIPNKASQINPKTESTSNTNTANTVSQLKYIIKPLDKKVATCQSMRNGKWDIPKTCRDDMLREINALIATNKELIALEISGIVDSNPYAGPSAELKQEGLASFRAREAIGIVSRAYSNVAVFEGLSIQEQNKRGFEVKAYYLQN